MQKFTKIKTFPKCPNCDTNKKSSLLESDEYNLFFCHKCHNGFLYPAPKNLAEFYPAKYWQFPGKLSSIREGLHNLLQIRRKSWIKNYLSGGEILDVVAGEGVFGNILGEEFKVTNLESPFSKVQNKNILRVNFLSWQTSQKFDGIVFLESLEHVSNPQQFLKKAASLLKPDGYIFIECPRFDCLESKMFGKYWLHRDIPRHLSHLTEQGIALIASRCRLKKVKQGGILLYEFSPYCFVVSLMAFFKIKPLNLRQKSYSNLLPLAVMLVFLPIAVVAETVYYFLHQAPIELSVFQKKTQ